MYISRGQFFEDAGQREKEPIRQTVLFQKALQDYQFALYVDPMGDATAKIPEKIRTIGGLLAKNNSSQGAVASASTATPLVLTREALSPAQVQRLEEIKARMCEEQNAQGTKNSSPFRSRR